MSAVLVLTPVVIASWPVIATTVAGVAASMGFTIVSGLEQEQKQPQRAATTKVETEVPNSEVLESEMGPDHKIVIRRDDVTITIGRDERGACTVCAEGSRHSKAELRQLGEEVAGRLVQQFAYHRLMTELKARKFNIVEQKVEGDESIRVRVRLNG